MICEIATQFTLIFDSYHNFISQDYKQYKVLILERPLDPKYEVSAVGCLANLRAVVLMGCIQVCA